MKIIPAIDLIDGKCVRLTQGDYAQQKTYSDDPVEVAKAFEDHGIKYLHVVDLDGARSKGMVNAAVLERIASSTSLEIDFGGGIKSDRDIQLAYDSGASKVTVGSIAVTEPQKVEEWIQRYGADKIILGADCKDQKIATHGWQRSSDLDVIAFIENYSGKGLTQVICTDINKDGMLAGPSFSLYRSILSKVNVQLIASGGVKTTQDLFDLKDLGCSGAIVGKAFYEGRI
ncbi:MAG: 1-(5-phosphoribosyl)-5-[(5-phosphoribosylamino)methylideneamino]imidazole-4-carboxamide isomerase, partial [Flavobacteriales bacterium]|nr:1-(5-phosphoribosyl)-5-[(5-phosphoribosylamino)methylideneamino]imidazole-4-carboxamide isomerase [Flavobacteriales bacterium]